MEDTRIYTGVTKYKDIDFTFVFNGENLRLIPTTENVRKVETEWLMTPIAKGTFIPNTDLKMEDSFLIGRCHENGKRIVFFTQKNANISSNNSVLIVQLIGYLECSTGKEKFGKISFLGPEINIIHPVNQSFDFSFNPTTVSSDGVFSITTKNFDITSTTPQEFEVDEKKVNVQLSVSRKFSTKILEPPILLESSMLFEFDETEDYDFLVRLWFIAKEFISFLCYRNNICMKPAVVSSRNQDGKYQSFGILTMMNQGTEEELYALKQNRCIKQSTISGHEGQILTDIACDSLYTRHLPKTYEDGRHIDASRFIMITAAFEWEFHRTYPNGVPKKESTILIENEAIEALQRLIDSSTGKLKNKYKFLSKLIRSDSLQTELVKIGEDFDSIIGNFGKHLYSLNGEELIYSSMGERLSSQRNHFAHGDLDKDFIGLALLDLIYLEYIVYAMQMKHYGIEDANIRNAINELFHLNFAL